MLDLSQLQHHIRELEKGHDAARRQAIRSLRDYKDDEWGGAPLKVIHAVVELLQHYLITEMKQASVRQDVVTILGNIGPRSELAIPQLIELLQEENPASVREAAATALGRIGRGLADQRIRTALLDLWFVPIQSPNGQVSVAVALCRLRIDAKGLLRFLASCLVANQESSLRQAAAEALTWCGKTEIDVVPALLMAALHDKDEEVRRIAEAGLAQLRVTREKAMHLCAKQLKDSVYAETALRNGGQLAVPALISALGNEDSTIREMVARTLGSLREVAVEAAPALTLALRDKDLDVRLAAAKGLWNVTKNAESVVPVLVYLLEQHKTAISDDGESRRRNLQTVMEALRRIGPAAKAAVSALSNLTKDKNRLVRDSALSALKEIAPTAAHKVVARSNNIRHCG